MAILRLSLLIWVASATAASAQVPLVGDLGEAPVAVPDAPLEAHSLLDAVRGLLDGGADPAPSPPAAAPTDDAPQAPAFRAPGAPPVPPAPEAPALALPEVEEVGEALGALPSLVMPAMPKETGLGGGETVTPQMPAMPAAPAAPRAPALPPPGAAPRAPAPPLGTQAVGADMAPRAGLGEALQGWAATAFGGAFAWYDGMPPAVRDALAAAAALLATGLITAAVWLTGFRHVDKQNLLEHTFRHQVLQLVREQPGIHLREVARRLGLTATNASYHLRVLERHGMLRSERLNGKRVYLPAAGPADKQRYLAQALLHRDSRARVLRALAAHPESNQTGLAAWTGQHQGAVSWHLRQLRDAGLVSEQRTPRECRYALTALGRELVVGAPAAPLQPATA